MNINSFISITSIAGLLMFIGEVIVNLVVIATIISIVKDSIKRKRSHESFKNNVVYSTDHLQNLRDNHNKNIYKDVQKDKLSMFNTDDINSLKDYFYDIFYQFETA